MADAEALPAGLGEVYTYDPDDWRRFQADGLRIAGPPSTLAGLYAPGRP